MSSPVVLVAFLSASALAFPSEGIHNHMTDDELDYYFGTKDVKQMPEYEVVQITIGRPLKKRDGGNSSSAMSGQADLDYSFSAFGNDFNLKLTKNDVLLSPTAQVVRRDGDSIEGLNKAGMDCHYLHRGDDFVAAISVCEGHNSMTGYIASHQTSLEIHSLPTRLHKRMMENATLSGRSRESRVMSGFVKKAVLPAHLGYAKTKDRKMKRSENKYSRVGELTPVDGDLARVGQFAPNGKQKRGSAKKTIETMVVLDEAAYRKFSRLKKSDAELTNLVLTFMNGIQAIYHLPSLGEPIDICIKRIELMPRQASDLPTRGGERNDLLQSFCSYNEKQNPDKSSPGHWDIGLYLSGIDFWAMQGGRRSDITMGLASVTGICSTRWNCVIGEWGVTTRQGRPFPSAGFTAVYVMAHEMGHNIGMHHDSNPGSESCDKDGYIMSPSRGTKGECEWSRCSADVLKKRAKELSCLEETKGKAEKEIGNNLPGEICDADQQCQLLLLDKDARKDHSPEEIKDICYTLKCRTPNRDGYYKSGPALEGTACGEGLWCTEGKCVKSPDKGKPSPTEGVWTDWKLGQCQSGCLTDGKGFLSKRRECQKQTPIRSVGGCRGPTTSFDFCDDSGICGSRTDVNQYANQQCKKFAEIVKALDPKGVGVQVKHNEENLRQACSIYCGRAGGKGWYTPRVELNDLPNVDVFFPDGTLCHTDADGSKYYCQRHMCLPEGARTAREQVQRIDILNNAKGNDDGVSHGEDLKDFFSMGDDLAKPKGDLPAKINNERSEEDYEDDDDFIIPK